MHEPRRPGRRGLEVSSARGFGAKATADIGCYYPQLVLRDVHDLSTGQVAMKVWRLAGDINSVFVFANVICGVGRPGFHGIRYQTILYRVHFDDVRGLLDGPQGLLAKLCELALNVLEDGAFCETECPIPDCGAHGNLTGSIEAAREANSCSALSCTCTGNFIGRLPGPLERKHIPGDFPACFNKCARYENWQGTERGASVQSSD